jgi:excisionase family DNA binding protein
MPTKPSTVLDTKTAAKELGISPRRVQALITAGKLPAQILGGTYIINRADLAKVRNRKPGRPKKKG